MNPTYKKGLIKVSLSFACISGLYLVLAIAPPILYHLGNPWTSSIRSLAGAICHQRPSRCFWIYDYPCGLCSKCLGFYLGIFLISIFCVLYRKVMIFKYAILSMILLLIVLLDSATGFLSKNVSYFLATNFLISMIGAVGAYSLFINKLNSGGRFMHWLLRKFAILLFIFAIIDLYGFSKAFGDSATPNVQANASIVIPGGTGVILEIEGGVSTKESREGDSVPLHVVSPVRVKDTVVIRGGTPARGIISMAHAASSWGGSGELVIEAKSVQAIDGTEILVSGSTSRRGETSHGTSAAVAVGTGVLCLPLALTGAAVKGEEGRVMPGFELVARTLNDQTIHIPSETEQLSIQKQQEELARKRRAEIELRIQKIKEEDEKKKQNSNSSKGDH
uniref:Putative membrane protein n=1 Tax=Desulfovibrio sp. U5L TaxID=596152 RepID=I2PZZ2_9BACT